MLATSQVPYQTKGKSKKVILTVTVDLEVKEALENQAKVENRSVSNMTNFILKDALL